MTTMKVWDGTAWQTTSLPVSAGTTCWVGTDAPAGTPTVGALWYDTDDVSTLQLPMSIGNGGTGSVTAPAARGALAVPAIGQSGSTIGAPTTGTWVRGDRWMDSAGTDWACVASGTPGTWLPPVGYEWAYSQVTANVTINTQSNNQGLIVEGTTRTYDGSPVMVEFFCGALSSNSSTQVIIDLWDGASDLGYLASTYGGAQIPCYGKRRITPTPGTHNYRIAGWVTAGSSVATAGPGGINNWTPTFVRVTRA